MNLRCKYRSGHGICDGPYEAEYHKPRTKENQLDGPHIFHLSEDHYPNGAPEQGGLGYELYDEAFIILKLTPRELGEIRIKFARLDYADQHHLRLLRNLKEKLNNAYEDSVKLNATTT